MSEATCVKRCSPIGSNLRTGDLTLKYVREKMSFPFSLCCTTSHYTITASDQSSPLNTDIARTGSLVVLYWNLKRHLPMACFTRAFHFWGNFLRFDPPKVVLLGYRHTTLQWMPLLWPTIQHVIQCPSPRAVLPLSLVLGRPPALLDSYSGSPLAVFNSSYPSSKLRKLENDAQTLHQAVTPMHNLCCNFSQKSAQICM